MRRQFDRRVLLALGSLLLYPLSTQAQKTTPPFPRDGATKVQDNDHFFAWDATLGKGKPTGTYKLDLDQVSVSLTEGAKKLTRPDGTWEIEQERLGSVRYDPKGTRLREECISDTPCRAMVFQLNQAIAAGSVIGPRLLLAGVLLEGPPSPRKGWIEVSTAAQGRATVDFLKKFGVDNIKVHDNLSRETYFAVADESKKQGLVFWGHVPNTVSVAEASDAGQKSEEHLLGILVGCSTQEPELMKAVAEHGLLANANALVETYSQEKCKALFAKFVKNETYIAPSLIRERVAPTPMTDSHLANSSPAIREEFQRQFNSFKPENVPALKMLHAAHYRAVKEMQQAGVKLLVGTDGRLFGYDVHSEMAEMVAAGLTPLQVLQAATKNAADYLGKLDSMGTIEKGKIADLVLLDANPLESIGNAAKIRSVVVNGRLLDRDALDRMQSQMKTGSNGTPEQAVGFADSK